MSKRIQALLDDAKKTDSYWVERAKLDFSLGLEKQRRAKQMSYAAIAQKISTSAAYITKVFRGDSNVTIETMVKLARATGGQINIEIIDSAAEPAKWDASRYSVQVVGMTTITPPTATVYKFPPVTTKTRAELLEAA